jgi:hypothetical protein
LKPGTFKPGASGNPGGRPIATTAVTAEAKRFAIEMIHGLVKLARTAENESVRKAAMDSVLDRALGKPAQALDHHLIKDIDKMSLDQLRDFRDRISGVAFANALPPPDADPANDLFATVEDEALGPKIIMEEQP